MQEELEQRYSRIANDAARVIEMPRLNVLNIIQIATAEARGALHIVLTGGGDDELPAQEKFVAWVEDYDWWPPYLRDAWQNAPRDEEFLLRVGKSWDDEFRALRYAVLSLAVLQLNLNIQVYEYVEGVR